MNTLFNHLPKKHQKNLENLNSSHKNDFYKLHGDRITAYLDNWLLDDEQQEMLKLNPWNIFFLSAAAHLFETEIAGSLERLETRGIIGKDRARIIHLICSGIKDFDQLLNTQKVEYEAAPVNISLLACAIRLGAELDLEHPNTARNIAGNLSTSEKIPFKQFCESFSVSYVGPHSFLSGTVQVRICCHHPEVHRALKHHESGMQKILHNINAQVSPRFLFSEIIYEIEPTGYKPLDMKFSVDSTAALQLFTGNRLYSDRRVFLRELIQNAVDACNLKKLFDDDYTPEISIDFDDQIKVVKFRDNGIGMDRQWIEKYFLKIGISFYQSGDIKSINQNRVDFNFISKFGIGFLSSFLVSDKIVIQTRKNDSPGLLITITNLQDYFDVRFAPEDCATGTQVTLYLTESKINYCRSIEYICFLKTNIRYLTIPVELLDHEGKATTLGQEKLAYDGVKNSGISYDFVTSLKFEDSEGYLFIKAKRNLNSLYALESARGGVSIFQDGIFVTQTESLLPEGARQNVIGRINLSGKEKCELSMDRNRIFWTEQQLQNIKRIIRLAMVDLAKQLLSDSGKLNPPLSINKSLINQLAIFFDFNEIDDQMYEGLGHPLQEIVGKRFRDFIRVNFAHTQKQSTIPEADGYGEKWQQKILASFAKRSRPPLP
ncbi:MAG: hypothetical protein GY699_16515 [Desulfobacteraceae bacterium]|nr:hypothetical protein [Desulfobacteraceae bacterium]